MNNIDKTLEHFSEKNSSFVLDNESYTLNGSLFSNNTDSSFNSHEYLELLPNEKTNELNNQIE